MVHHVYPTTFPPLSEHPEYIAKYLVVGIHIWDFPHHAQVIVNIFAMHGQKLSRQRSHSFDEDQDGEWWPPPLTEEDVAIRQRAKRLLQAIRQIPLVYYDIKAWENEHENVFSLFRQGCLDGAKSKILEAALYNNQQIEDAWLFLLEMRRRHRNRRRHVQECVHVLGASYNWSMVLEGSRKILEALNDLPQEICTEILEDANAHDLLRSIYPNQRRPRRQDDWLTSPSSSPTNGWSDSDPWGAGKDTTPGETWPEQRTPKNPFKFADAPNQPSSEPPFRATEWPDAQRPEGRPDVFPQGRFPSEPQDTNPFRKEVALPSGNPFNAHPAGMPGRWCVSPCPECIQMLGFTEGPSRPWVLTAAVWNRSLYSCCFRPKNGRYIFLYIYIWDMIGELSNVPDCPTNGTVMPLPFACGLGWWEDCY